MTIYKDRESHIDYDVSDYVFEPLEGENAESQGQAARTFEFREISSTKFQPKDHQKIIKKERTHATKNNFKIAPIVLEHRGLLAQEQEERELRVRDEVERRLMALKERAYEEGYQKGQEQGRQEVYEQTKQEVEEKLDAVQQMVNQILSTQQDMLEQYKIEIYQVVKNLTKWVTLKELEGDGTYLERLLEKLILEINMKSNLLIKVGANNFKRMPEVFDIVQGRIGQLQNVRLEVDSELDDLGLIVESENGIINASFAQQVEAIEKLFESLGVVDDPA